MQSSEGVHLPPDPVIEAYKKDIDRTLLRENLKLTPAERLQKLMSFLASVEALRRPAAHAMIVGPARVRPRALLVAAPGPLHPYLRGAPANLPFVFDAATVRRGLNFTLTTDLGYIDLLGEVVGGRGFEALLPYTDSVDLEGFTCRVLALQKLIAIKRAAGRPKDHDAIAELEALVDESARLHGSESS